MRPFYVKEDEIQVFMLYICDSLQKQSLIDIGVGYHFIKI